VSNATPDDKKLMLDALRQLSTLPKRAYALILARFDSATVPIPTHGGGRSTVMYKENMIFRDLTPELLIYELTEHLARQHPGDTLRVEIFEEPPYKIVFEGDAALPNKIIEGGWSLHGDSTYVHRMNHILNQVGARLATMERERREFEEQQAKAKREQEERHKEIENATPAELSKLVRRFRQRRLEGDRKRATRRQGWL
jgi:hypothetical protein